MKTSVHIIRADVCERGFTVYDACTGVVISHLSEHMAWRIATLIDPRRIVVHDATSCDGDAATGSTGYRTGELRSPAVRG